MQKYGIQRMAMILSVACILLAACGEKGEKFRGESQSEENSVYYEAEYAEMSVQGEIMQFHFWNDTVFYLEVDDSDYKLMKHGTNQTTEECVISFAKGERVTDFGIFSDGKIVAGMLGRPDTEKKFTLRIYEADGRFLGNIPFPEISPADAAKCHERSFLQVWTGGTKGCNRAEICGV